MARVTRSVGMGIHAEAIAVALAEGREVRSLGTLPNRADAVGKLIKNLGDPGSLRICYGAGPTG
jgi:transposase